MEKKSASPPSDSITVSPPSKSPPPSDHYNHTTQDFASAFSTLYHSIFPPKPSPLPFSLTPSTSSPSSADDFDTNYSLHQARLILEYQELSDHYDRSLARLHSLTKEIDSIRQENADLRSANNELVKLLSLSSRAAIQSRFRSRDSPEPSRFDRRKNVERERVSLPKSISVRSSGYLKLNRAGDGCSVGQTSTYTRTRVLTHLDQLVSGSVS